MERAVVPTTIGVAASFAVLFQYWVVEKAPEILVHSLVNASQRWLWQQALSDLGVAVDWWGIWHCGAIIILYYSRVELLECCRRLLGCLHLALAAVHICLHFLCDWLVVGSKWLGISRQLPPPTDVETAERESPLTWPSMAVVPAGGPVLPPGTFILVSRAPEWDEVLVLGFAEGGQTALCKTTTPDGTDWAWVLVNMLGLFIRLPLVAADGSRQAPAGLAAGDVNWICTPPRGAGQWIPSAAEIGNATAEASLILRQFQNSNPGWVINQPGAAGPLVPLIPAAGGPIGPGGGGGAAVAPAVPGGAGLGIAPPGPADGGPGPAMDLKQLEAAVQQLQTMALNPSNASGKPKKKKKKKKKSDRKQDKKKKKKKKKRSGSSSSSSSSSNRSRSRSSSTSSSNSKKKPLRWKQMVEIRKSATPTWPMSMASSSRREET